MIKNQTLLYSSSSNVAEGMDVIYSNPSIGKLLESDGSARNSNRIYNTTII